MPKYERQVNLILKKLWKIFELLPVLLDRVKVYNKIRLPLISFRPAVIDAE